MAISFAMSANFLAATYSPPHERLVVAAPVPIAGHGPGNAGPAQVRWIKIGGQRARTAQHGTKFLSL